VTALFDGICVSCHGYGEHFDWCPLLPGSASAPAAPTGVHPARDAQGAASGDARASSVLAASGRPSPIGTPGAASRDERTEGELRG
jgi:hypothetical protein